MKVEIKAFYKYVDQKENDLAGSLHIFLPDVCIHLRGVLIFRKKWKWILVFPQKKIIDQITKKWVTYPIFSFDDREKQIELHLAIREAAIEFITTQIQAEILTCK